MQIKQDPISKLWCHDDGAVLMPPNGFKYKTFRWTFGTSDCYGYKQVRFYGKIYKVHQIICRAFHGLAPIDKPLVDHINRIKSDNRPENLHWASREENATNADRVDQSMEKYGVRYCDDPEAYGKAFYDAHREECRVYARAYQAAKHTKMRAQGLAWKKDPNGKWGWYPRVRKSEAA